MAADDAQVQQVGGRATGREASMVVIERAEDGTPTVWCDPEIVDLVAALNAAGIRTVASCSGHGHRPGNIALADGRELVVAADYEQARAVDQAFPDIHGVVLPDFQSASKAPRRNDPARIEVDPNPCRLSAEGCPETYTRGHICERNSGHGGRCRCICGANYTAPAASQENR